MRLSSFSIGFQIWVIVLCFFLGAALGSFMNCIAGRIVRHEDWIHGRSKCDACGHVLGWRDLIPVFTYLLAKGRCRYCGEKVSPRYVITEVLSGILSLLIVLRFDVSVKAVSYLILYFILLGLSLIDLETMEIPDGFIIAGIVNWLAGIIFEYGFGKNLLTEAWHGLAGGLGIAGFILVLSLIFDMVTDKNSMGGGDIKLFFMTTLYLGFGKGFYALILSCLIGIIAALASKQNRIPFGPCISVAVIMGLLTGDWVLNLYLGLF